MLDRGKFEPNNIYKPIKGNEKQVLSFINFLAFKKPLIIMIVKTT